MIATRTLLLFTLAIAVPLVAASAAAQSNGQKVFLAHKCNQCHTVKAAGIDLSGVPEGRPTDLSSIGSKHTTDWMRAFLLKKEALNGSKHKRKFTGTDAELGQLLDWLAGLKG